MANRQNTDAMMKIKGGVLYHPGSQHQVEPNYLDLLVAGIHPLIAT